MNQIVKTILTNKKTIFLLIIIVFAGVGGMYSTKIREWYLSKWLQRNEIADIAPPEALKENAQFQKNPSNWPVSPVQENDYLRGGKNSKLILIAYTSLNCLECKDFHNSISNVVEESNSKLSWVYRPMMQAGDENSLLLAEGAECAGKSAGTEGYWKYIDEIYKLPEGITIPTEEALLMFVEDLGVNVSAWSNCMKSDEGERLVEEKQKGGFASGIRTAPSTLVYDPISQDSKLLSGPIPYEALKEAMDHYLQGL